ncbi:MULTISPECIES: hypothetical protein [Nostocales]|uniref:Uncharacterized protein n=3 Tax=Nostocales TaxID=1161 RepID=A0A8S9TG88_9CYAN|nr:hypothetical protein [Tolypothrix bouteillei]KAF3890947.1 hypothetical protein DA73_0400012920 [Tolypothrix bouteillei VB521301]
MEPPFCLSPRYRLDDELPWLEGIDPSRHYWIAVNGDTNLIVAIPGLTVSSIDELKHFLREFRALQPQERMTLTRLASACTIYCISSNCYAIEREINGAVVWHLFDQETLESLLRTAHPDWQCASKDLELGRSLLMRSFQQTAAIKS